MAILIIKAVTGDKILSLIPLQENMNHKVCILQSCNPIHGVPSKSSSMKLKRKNKVKKEMVFQFSLCCYQLREVTPKTVLRGPRIPIAWLEFSHWKRPMSWVSLPDCSWELNLFSEFLINYGVSFHKRKMRLASSSWNSLLVSSFSMCKFLHYSYNCICSVLVFPVVILHYKKCWRKKKKNQGGKKKKPQIQRHQSSSSTVHGPNLARSPGSRAELECSQHSCRHWYKTQPSPARKNAWGVTHGSFENLSYQAITCQQTAVPWCLVVNFWKGAEGWKNLEDHRV